MFIAELAALDQMGDVDLSSLRLVPFFQFFERLGYHPTSVLMR